MGHLQKLLQLNVFGQSQSRIQVSAAMTLHFILDSIFQTSLFLDDCFDHSDNARLLTKHDNFIFQIVLS